MRGRAYIEYIIAFSLRPWLLGYHPVPQPPALVALLQCSAPALEHCHKCEGLLAPARAAAPPVEAAPFLLFACQRSYLGRPGVLERAGEGQAVGSVSENLWAEGAHHSLKAVR